MWKFDYKENWGPKNWCFWTVVLEKTLESPLHCKKIKPVHPKGNQSWTLIGKTFAKTETPILWLPDVENWFIGKNSDVGKDWRREEKGQQRLRWLYVITNSMDMSLSKLQEWWWTVKPVVLQSMELQRVGHDWASELNWTKSLWLCGSQQSMENYYRWEYQITLPAFCKICIQVKKQHFEQTWNNGLISNWEMSASRLYTVTLPI